MGSFPNIVFGSYGEEKETCSSAANTMGCPIGTIMQLPDGRKFVLSQASTAATIGAGLVVQSAVPNASTDMDIPWGTAASIGDRTVYIAVTATTVATDAFAGGYIYVNDASGEGHVYRIKENTAITASGASATITVELEDSDAMATTTAATTTLCGLVKSHYKDVVVRPTTITERAIGVTPVQAGAGYYFWCQTYGDAACLVAATVCVLGMNVVSSTAGTAGSVTVAQTTMASTAALGDDLVEQVIGYATNVAAVNTDYQSVFLTIG